jgi:hypothetical protein
MTGWHFRPLPFKSKLNTGQVDATPVLDSRKTWRFDHYLTLNFPRFYWVAKADLKLFGIMGWQ